MSQLPPQRDGSGLCRRFRCDCPILATCNNWTRLSRRIIGALQIDGRASWRRIADALNEPVRTVSRRGTTLLDDRTVQVVGLPSHSPTHLLRLKCRPDSVQSVAREVARLPQSVFVYAVSGSAEVVAELMMPFDALAPLLLDELPRIHGVQNHSLTPVLQYFRTVAEWLPTSSPRSRLPRSRSPARLPSSTARTRASMRRTRRSSKRSPPTGVRRSRRSRAWPGSRRPRPAGGSTC